MKQWLYMFERQMTPQAMLRVYLVVGGRSAVLVDTAMVGYEELVTEALQVVQRLRIPLKFIVNTHAHHDHIGLNHWVQTQTGALVAAHRWGKPWIEVPERNYQEFVLAHPHLIADSPALQGEIYNTLGPGIPLDIGLRGGEVLNLGELEAEVVDLSGHVPGEIGLLVRDKQTLITGDALTCSNLPFFHGHMRPDLYRATLNRINVWATNRQLDCIYSIHQSPILGCRDITMAVQERQDELDRLDRAVEDELHSGTRSLKDLWLAVSARWGKQPEFRGLTMVHAHLADLCQRGRVEQLGELFRRAET